MNYNDAKLKLDTPIKKDSKKLENNTYLIRHENYIGVKLHDTEVVKLYPDHAELFTGGWFTNTTRDRINKYSPVFVHTAKSIWYIGNYDDNSKLYYDGIKVDYNGNIISEVKDPTDTEKKNAKIKKEIKSFVEYATEQVEKGIDLPSGGDCWYCALKSQNKKTLGDETDNTDHLWQHIKEKYVVPSLVWNAVKERGYQYPEIIIGYSREGGKSGEGFWVKESVKNALRRYLTDRLLVR